MIKLKTMKKYIIICFSFLSNIIYGQKYIYLDRDTTIEEYQKAVEFNLKTIRLSSNDTKEYSFFSGLKREHFTEKAKLMIIDLLNNKWTEEDVQSDLRSGMKEIIDTTLYWNESFKDAKRIAKRDSLPLQRVWDSMLKVRIEQERKSIIKAFKVPIRVVKIAGFLKDPRFIPLLKKLLETEKDKERHFYTRMALAVCRVSPYYEEFIDRYLNKGLKGLDNNYIYEQLCNRDMVDSWIKWTMTNDELNYDSNGKAFAYLAEGGLYAGSEFKDKAKGKRLKKELDSLVRLREKGKPRDYRYPETVEDLNEMRQIFINYFKDYKMEEIDCRGDVFYEVW